MKHANKNENGIRSDAVSLILRLTMYIFSTKSPSYKEPSLPRLHWILYPYHTDVIDSIYRRRLGPLSPSPQSVLSAIINGALDNSFHTYASCRKNAISLIDPLLHQADVDKAGHRLYKSCCKNLPLTGFSKHIFLKQNNLSPPKVAAFFALAQFCREAKIRVLYLSRDEDRLLASI
ncbi:uncharacterized protein EV420DRAFT_1744718 [Desarmillaria tabescens]|uniref:Uncharacterized protein n=1 Tax=Armillaria tabescens TaxID=1929756 RepID=A0AA39NF00_ARMTA|nr:uncharacterized protein EV420DRAFT_1744718 [Desarmillaria tabescens]KAK0464299.1 hypothetical protein EV420DRAFT_1744718 [Desarmillaria tabescens]